MIERLKERKKAWMVEGRPNDRKAELKKERMKDISNNNDNAQYFGGTISMNRFNSLKAFYRSKMNTYIHNTYMHA